MNRITVKLVLFIIFLICVSSLVSFLASIMYTRHFEDEMELNQAELARAIRMIDARTDMSIDEIVEVLPTSIYQVRIVEDVHDARVSERDLRRIQAGEVIYISSGIKAMHPETIFMLGETYVQIRLFRHGTIFHVVGSRVWFALVLSILTAALLSSLLAKKVVRPILKLTAATQEVAKGNFDIQVESTSRDDIGLLTDNFNKMTRELRNIEYLRKDFVTSVSHEFKTPLASIQGFAKLLQKGNLPEAERQEYTDIIVKETTRLTNLSANILKLSKLENQEIVEKRERFSLDEQIRRSILLLEPQWSKKDIEFDIQLDRGWYVGDEELMQQVWINLLENAIKFSHAGGLIKVGLAHTDDGVEVEIQDYGIGMSEDTRKRIFDKFYQGDKTHSGEGSGLGLSLVKRIVDLFGGKVVVESSLGEGSSFRVQLPMGDLG